MSKSYAGKLAVTPVTYFVAYRFSARLFSHENRDRLICWLCDGQANLSGSLSCGLMEDAGDLALHELASLWETAAASSRHGKDGVVDGIPVPDEEDDFHDFLREVASDIGAEPLVRAYAAGVPYEDLVMPGPTGRES